MTMTPLRNESVEAMRLLSHIYLQFGRADNSLALLRALCLLMPDDRGVMLATARAAIRAGQPQEAEGILNRLRDLGEFSPALHLLQGQALAALGRPGEAQRAFGDFVACRHAPRDTELQP
jgi:Flp pilus assembly protein TadD